LADFYESFDNGVGALSHVWGNVDTSVRGQVTLTGNSGMMERPWGADAGHGYGTYTVTAALHGDQVGSAALLWPGNDKWPGPEFDIVEVIHGMPYGTVHFDGGGSDRYNTVSFSGLDESQAHAYTLDWQPGSISYDVDGNAMGTVTKRVGADHAHGGINEVFGLMNTNWHTSMTVYEVSYTPMAEAQAWSPPVAVEAGFNLSVGAGPIDWNALAAAVTANFEATGQWFY